MATFIHVGTFGRHITSGPESHNTARDLGELFAFSEPFSVTYFSNVKKVKEGLSVAPQFQVYSIGSPQGCGVCPQS